MALEDYAHVIFPFKDCVFCRNGDASSKQPYKGKSKILVPWSRHARLPSLT